jgi:hypothetical protein
MGTLSLSYTLLVSRIQIDAQAKADEQDDGEGEAR